jgi:hypothetical protein
VPCTLRRHTGAVKPISVGVHSAAASVQALLDEANRRAGVEL